MRISDWSSDVCSSDLNATVMVGAIAAALAAADPANEALYHSNAESMTARLEALAGEIEAALAPVKGGPLIVFHDTFQNFDHRFGLKTFGSLTVHPETNHGARRLREIQRTEETRHELK